MRELVWEWLLADGSSVRATLDRARDEESVWVDERLVSRAAIGARPEGHRIGGSPYRDVGARVTFAPDAPDAKAAGQRCALRRGDDVVAPHTWPGRSLERVRRAVVVAAPIALAASCVAFGLAGVAFLAGTQLATREVDRFGGPVSEARVVGTSTAPAPQVAPVTARAKRVPSRSVHSLPSAPAVVVAQPDLYDPFTATFTARPRPPPPPRPSMHSASRPPSSPVTVDVVCDAQGACQGVKPVRLSPSRS
ncbi:MAG: hypothetical protein JST00_33270 [Deltaproteobacteria bacterium]|nr:hypothetical protein [Deltaproteobacteria bacterium]